MHQIEKIFLTERQRKKDWERVVPSTVEEGSLFRKKIHNKVVCLGYIKMSEKYRWNS